jgi:hypothetical protein
MSHERDESETGAPPADAEPEPSKQLTTTQPIGSHLGYRVFVGPHRRPDGAPLPDEFGLNLFIPNKDGENASIARIDTDHDGCHIDRLYLPEGHRRRRQDYSVDVFSPEGALRYFLEHDRWQEWVEKYDANHGLPQKATDIDRE